MKNILEVNNIGGRSSSSGMGGGSAVLPNDSARVNYEISEFTNWKNGLTPDQLRAAQEYALDSTLLNAYLRGDRDAPRNLDVKKRVADLDAAIDAHSLSSSLTVYRGVGKDYLGLDLANEESVKKLVGKTIKDKAYMSTSLSKEVGEVYSRGVVLKINVPKGTKAMNPDLAESSAKQLKSYLADGDAGNMELVFKRNSGLKITGYTRKKSAEGKSYLEIQAVMR